MKKSLADRIEQYLKVLIDRSEENQIEIQRAELAETFCCVPSQVTYVLSTRFTESEGYYTHSRRGGKGFVRITRFNVDNYNTDELSNQLFIYLEALLNSGLITSREAGMVKSIFVSGLRYIPPENRYNLVKAIGEGVKEYINNNE
ncbi:MAG TPA: transcriptional regulator [Syntrophomonas sp.]|jgi:transcriptional regulator CtsR|nr:transcriptional regulator [Syntrophomonas sp.]HCF71457.1 transcriptional regulator [Syntrophomonas sp.]